MSTGVFASLKELIDFRRYALSTPYYPLGKGARSGAHLSKVRGRGMDFSEVRHYQAGDEVRHMEWRVTARTGRPHVKMFQEERERPTVLLVDFNPSMIFGTRGAFKSVVAARLAAMIAWSVSRQGDRVGGFFFSASEHSEFVPKGRDSSVLPLLASLAHYSEQTPIAQDVSPRLLSDALVRLRRVIRPGSIIVLISDFYAMDADAEQHLARLCAHNDVLAYQISDPLELCVPKPNYYPITNGRDEMLFNTHAPGIQQAYTHYCTERIALLQEQFKRLGIHYVGLTAQTDIPLLVRQTFPRRVSNG